MAIDLAADAILFLADFAETIVYRPRDGGPRSIQAIVRRDGPGPLSEAPGAVAETVRLTVLNDRLAGIASDELDLGGDRVDVSRRLGEAVRTLSLTRILAQDEGLLQLEAR